MNKIVASVWLTPVCFIPESFFQGYKDSEESLCFPKTTEGPLTSEDTIWWLKDTLIKNLLEQLLYSKIKLLTIT